MRFKIQLQLKNNQLPLDFRPAVISLFKHSLTVYQDGKHFDTYYDIGKSKLFTFSVNIPSSNFGRDFITVPSKEISIMFSTGNNTTGIVFFNALLMQKNIAFPLAFGNYMTITNMIINNEIPIMSDTISVIFKSPLCVRQHIKEGNKDIYYSYEKEGFNTALNNVLEWQITNSNLPATLLKGFSLVPVQCKKTVVLHLKQYIEVTLGVFKLTGNIALLNYFYANGIGSRKSSGFGMMEIIRNEIL
ncbi:MAG: cas6 [Firmicutes bacterium]|nr:cas6 [Bacillota bacterium]